MNWKYAVGEIVLIVIGILIAVQINNWNQDRIENLNETALINNLLDDLQANMTMYLARDSVNLKRSGNIEKFVNEIQVYKDSSTLRRLSYPPERLYDEFDPVRSTFNQMENNGMIYKLSDESIKNGIIDYYTLISESQRLLRVQQSFVQEQYNHKDLMIMRENHFRLFKGQNIPISDLKWMNDFSSDEYKAYKSMVYMIQGIINFENYQMILLKKECGELIDMIQKLQ